MSFGKTAEEFQLVRPCPAMSGHDHGEHGGGGGDGVPALSYFPRMYWALVGAVIGLATLVNIANALLYRQRQVVMMMMLWSDICMEPDADIHYLGSRQHGGNWRRRRSQRTWCFGHTPP